MKRLLLIAILLVAPAGFAQSIHITAMRTATHDSEKTYHTIFNQNIITGVIENRRYTLEQLAPRGPAHLEVGKDYQVVKVTDKEIKILVINQKGKETTERLNVVSIEEVSK